MLSHSGFLFCPKCASSQIHEHTFNSMRCESCGFVYFHNTAAAVGGIVLYQDKIVLLRRGHEPMKGTLDVPGGFVDYNESAEDALKREIKEEMNIEVNELTYFAAAGNTYRYKDVTYFTSDIFYIVNINSVSEFIPSDEVPEMLLIKPSELDVNLIGLDSVRKIVDRFCKSY